MNEEMVQNLILPLNGSKCVPIVRPWKIDSDVIGKVIDTVAMGIIIHMVNRTIGHSIQSEMRCLR